MSMIGTRVGTKRLQSIALLFAVLAVLGATAAEAGNKVRICHIPPGNPSNFHTIRISENAYSAHLAHGDLGGPCNEVCATLCDDGNACTIDDTGDCEQAGCPATAAQVDCSDQNECTADSCDALSGCVNAPRVGEACDDGQICSGPDACDAEGACQGAEIENCCLGNDDCSQNPCDRASCNSDTNRCDEDPVECVARDLCSVNECAPDTGQCVEADVLCPEGEICSPCTGECNAAQACPCSGLCWDGPDGQITWGNSFTTVSCLDAGDPPPVFTLASPVGTVDQVMFSCSDCNLPGGTACGYLPESVFLPEDSGHLFFEITPEEAEACRQSLLAITGADGVTCD